MPENPSTPQHPQHLSRLYGPEWHAEQETPVVDGKYIDRTTGEVLEATGCTFYLGPPAVDIIIKGQHAETAGCTLRAARLLPLETLLHQITTIISERKLEVDSLMATPYAIRVILLGEMTREEFYEAAREMVRMDA